MSSIWGRVITVNGAASANAGVRKRLPVALGARTRSCSIPMGSAGGFCLACVPESLGGWLGSQLAGSMTKVLGLIWRGFRQLPLSICVSTADGPAVLAPAVTSLVITAAMSSAGATMLILYLAPSCSMAWTSGWDGKLAADGSTAAVAAGSFSRATVSSSNPASGCPDCARLGAWEVVLTRVAQRLRVSKGAC